MKTTMTHVVMITSMEKVWQVVTLVRRISLCNISGGDVNGSLDGTWPVLGYGFLDGGVVNVFP